ncbi:ferric reductase-like transmembrane domain-containing protein [Candidatus Woesearchaeota archaeon]|nr:ferric reductase-like transmembrane domain-containing protein [Candidatus Woesearchaeota archaeon]
MNWKIIIPTIISLILYIFLSSSVRNTELIWVLTRFFGILSLTVLMIVVILGELRMLTVIKADFVLFRFHKPLGIFLIFLVIAHFISAVFDKFMWGKTLLFHQFLGFSFSDKWLVLLSLGTLAFYLLFIVGATSSQPAMQFLRFKRWKMIHLLSYLAYLMAYIHSVNLGTDIKHSILSPFLSIFFTLGFLVATALFLSRMLQARIKQDDQASVVLATIIIVILIIGTVGVGIAVLKNYDYSSNQQKRLDNIEEDISYVESQVELQKQKNDLLLNQLGVLENEE